MNSINYLNKELNNPNNKYFVANKYYNNFIDSYNEIESYYKKNNKNKHWDTILSLDSFNKMSDSNPREGLYKFAINNVNPRTYDTFIGSYQKLENITEMRIDKFKIPLPFLKNNVSTIASDNVSMNSTMEFLNSALGYPDENILVNSDYNQNTTSDNGSDYLAAYKSQLTDGKVYIGIRELANNGAFNQKGNVYHFEFVPKFVADPYPSLFLHPTDDNETLIFNTPISSLTTISVQFMTKDDKLRIPEDIITCTAAIETTDNSLYFIPKLSINNITSYRESLRGTYAYFDKFTFNYKNSDGYIYDVNGNKKKKNYATVKSSYGTYENYLLTNGTYVDITGDDYFIPIPTPSNLTVTGDETFINYQEDNMGNLSLYDNTSVFWSATDYTAATPKFNLKLLAHRVIIPLRIRGLVSDSNC